MSISDITNLIIHFKNQPMQYHEPGIYHTRLGMIEEEILTLSYQTAMAIKSFTHSNVKAQDFIVGWPNSQLEEWLSERNAWLEAVAEYEVATNKNLVKICLHAELTVEEKEEYKQLIVIHKMSV